MNIKAVVYPADEGGFWAKVPSLPGVYTRAETLAELEANFREAVVLYLSTDIEAEEEAAVRDGKDELRRTGGPRMMGQEVATRREKRTWRTQ